MTRPMRTLLIVEDFPADRELYRRCLLADPSCAYDFVEVDCAIAGLELCRTQVIDAILLDYLLPDADGLEFLEALHAQSHGNSPPVVMVTGEGDEAIAVRALKLGAEDYLVKRQLTPERLQLTMRSAIENARLRLQLQQSHDRFRVSIENMLDCFGIYSAIRDESGQIVDFKIDYLNAAALESNRMTQADIGKGLCEVLPAHRETGLFEEYCRVVETGEPLVKEDLIYSDVFGVQLLTRAYDVHVSKLEDGFVASWRDVTARKQAELERQQQLERERIVNHITGQVRRSLDVNEILNTTVSEIRQFLAVDRAFIYQFQSDFSGTIAVESVGAGWMPALNAQVEDTCFMETRGEDYRQGRIQAVEDIYTAGLSACHVEMLARFQIRANLVIPILQGEELWGLLVVNQCARPRQWQPLEIDLLKQLATQAGIAIHQAELYQQVRTELAERQRAEAALCENERRFREIFNTTFQFVGLLTPDGILLEANQTLLDFGGLTREEAVGRPFWEVRWWTISPQTQQQLQAAIAKAAQGEFVRYEVEVLGAGDATTTIDFSLKPVRDESGQVVMLIPEGRDISDRIRYECDFKRSEAELRTNQAQLQLAMRSAQMGFWNLNLITQESVWSSEAKQLLGLPIDWQECSYEILQRRIYPNDRNLLDRAIAEAIEVGSYAIEFRVVWDDGSIHWLADKGQAFYDETGRAVRLVGLATDITDRKITELALQQANDRFELAAAAVNCIIYDWDLQKDTVERTRGLDEITGYLPQEADPSSQWWFDLIHPDDRAKKSREKVFAELTQFDRLCTEYRVHHKDGRYIWVEDWGRIIKNELGQPIRIVGSTRDISDRKQIESNLHDSEERFQQLANHVPHLFWISEPMRQRLIYASPAYEKIWGRPLAEVYADYRQWIDAIHPDDLARVEAHFAQTILLGDYNIEYRIIRPDGSIRWIYDRGFPIQEESGEVRRVAGIAEDITQRKQWEQEREQLLTEAEAARAEAEAANRSKDEFVAVVAHELRSPLNSVLGWAQLLQTREFDAKTTAKALETISRNTRAQVQLVEDLLDISRMVRGTLQLSLAPVNLVEAIEAALDLVRPMAEAKQIRIQTQLTVKPRISGDFNRLQQIVVNLLTNAIKFTPSGGRVDISLEELGSREQGAEEKRAEGAVGRRHPKGGFSKNSPSRRMGAEEAEGEKILHPTPHTPHPSSRTTHHQLPTTNYAQITISDTGKGISADFLPSIFERFQQGQKNSGSKDGLGLGLAIVKHLVELHAGTITAESQGIGQGATFTIRLPLLEASEKNTSEADLVVSDAATLAGIRVLVVDDEPDAIALITCVLEDRAALVQSATSAATALELLNQFKPDILISDIAMPGGDGYELVQQMRSHRHGQIPAIALTAYASATHQERSLLAGFEQHLTKPVEPEALVAAILNLVKGKGE